MQTLEGTIQNNSLRGRVQTAPTSRGRTRYDTKIKESPINIANSARGEIPESASRGEQTLDIMNSTIDQNNPVNVAHSEVFTAANLT